jgi:hypothetical protein
MLLCGLPAISREPLFILQARFLRAFDRTVRVAKIRL